jgi:hypothetical protein
VSGSSGVNPWRGGTEATSSFECGWAGGTGGVLWGECAIRLVDEPNARSGVRIMFPRVVSVVNGEPALDESIANAMSDISEMLCCLNGQLGVGCVCSLFASLSDGDRGPFISDAVARSFRANPCLYHEARLGPFSRFPYFLLRRQQKKSRMAHMTKTATPPTTPPMIAPLFEDAALGLSDGVLDGDALVARTEDNAVTPVGSVVVDMSELVGTCEIVSATGDVSSSETGGVSEALGVSEPADVVVEVMEAVEDASVDKVVDSDKVDVDEAVVVLGVTLGNKSITPAVVNESVSPLSSGQIPVVHGSLEQHPRKSPAVQTYHCLVPVQVLSSRGTRDSRARETISNT